MKKHIVICFICMTLFTPGFTANSAFSAADEWKFDTAHSRFYFDIDHIFVKVRGHFGDYSGKIFFDPDKLRESSFFIEIKTNSVDTGIRKRDNHLRSDDFFHVKKYPLMTFRSREIQHASGDLYSVTGDLTIKDVTKTITIPMRYFGTKDEPFNPKQVVAGFEARLQIDRFDFNVGKGQFYKMGVAGKDVDITVALELLRPKD